ncbi:plasmid mobilization relaxosome protein MobC [Lachnospiraceae bacterium 48-21]
MGRRKIEKTADSHSKKVRRSDSTKKESMKCRKEIRLSSTELEMLKKQAEDAGMSDSCFLRSLITNRPRDYPVIRQELQRLNNEINHIGVNINQITHNNNSRLYSREDKHRLYVFMKGLKELLQQVIEKL